MVRDKGRDGDGAVSAGVLKVLEVLEVLEGKGTD